MLKRALLLSLILFFLQPAFAQEEDSDDRIYWSEWFKLEWTDFQGKSNGIDGIAAQSSIGLPYKFQSDGEGSMTVILNVCFLKGESWSVVDKQNNVLLQHEQLHFDIAELHRRMMVKDILEAKFNKENYQSLLEKIISDNWNVKYRRMQDKYDTETNFSRIIREQINWNRFVQQQLKNLEEFTFTELEVSLIQFDD